MRSIGARAKMPSVMPRVSEDMEHQPDRQAWADALGISRAAIDLYLASEVIDLHIDSFIWRRLFGYDLHARHGRGLFHGCFYSQVDVPRLREAHVGGALWIVTTNPFRTRRGRRAALLANVERLEHELTVHGTVEVVDTAAGYRAARTRGAHAAFLGIQGGNALSRSLDDFDDPRLAKLSLVTLMHFTRSRIGAPALPWFLRFGDQQLSSYGRDYVHKLNQRRIMIDLAHTGPRAFADVLAVHDRTQPLTLSHAACAAVHPHFRNASDAQLRAVADTGGVIGVIFNTAFLGGSLFAGSAERVIDHIVHLVQLVGADHVSLGSDFDGAIVPPRDLRSVLELPRLVELMLRRGMRELDIQKVLGVSFLRALSLLRG
jgi:membrane dipeptidase